MMKYLGHFWCMEIHVQVDWATGTCIRADAWQSCSTLMCDTVVFCKHVSIRPPCTPRYKRVWTEGSWLNLRMGILGSRAPGAGVIARSVSWTTPWSAYCVTPGHWWWELRVCCQTEKLNPQRLLHGCKVITKSFKHTPVHATIGVFTTAWSRSDNAAVIKIGIIFNCCFMCACSLQLLDYDYDIWYFK
jgi:hypothetical protein